jgi:phage terminase Nu1 subunit (DNA packaging protein)
LDFKERNGQLLDAAATESKWSRIIADARNRLLACPGRIASRIGHLQKSEVDVIDREIRNALTELGE